MRWLHRQLLDQQFTGSIGELVEAVAGLNAQTARGPIVGLWTRMSTLDLAELDRALRGYELVKANLMRGTVHLVTRRQYVTWRQALQPMLERTVRGFVAGLWDRVDHDDLLHAGTELLRAHDGLTRAEIGRALAPQFPVPDPRQLGFAIRLLLPVVQVADDHAFKPARTRYILAEQAFDDALIDADEGRLDLLRSFLRAFGPAAATDVSYWSGLTRLRPALAEAATHAVEADPAVGDAGPFDVEPIADSAPRSAFVLPEFDNVYFCSKNTDRPLINAKKRLVRSGAMPGSLVSGDQVCAHWRWTRPPELTQLTPWHDLAPAATDEFARFARWAHAADEAVS